MLMLLIYLSQDLKMLDVIQDIKHDYTAELAGSKDRSEYDIEGQY